AWQVRIAEADFILSGIEVEPKRGLQHEEKRPACPGLRRAGDRIEGWASAMPPLKAAEQLGQTAQLHIGRRRDHTLEYGIDGRFMSVSCKAECNERVVVRPNRTVVVGHGIVPSLLVRNRADAPTREQVRIQQPPNDLRGTVRLGDSRE